jgi:prevent-host-death family protein
MAQTTAAEFQRKFGEIQRQAQREPVGITRHGRRELVLMSAALTALSLPIARPPL